MTLVLHSQFIYRYAFLKYAKPLKYRWLVTLESYFWTLSTGTLSLALLLKNIPIFTQDDIDPEIFLI